jgi:hypothetical protein
MAEMTYKGLQEKIESLIRSGNSPRMAIRVMEGRDPYNLTLSLMSFEETQELLNHGRDYANKLRKG